MKLFTMITLSVLFMAGCDPVPAPNPVPTPTPTVSPTPTPAPTVAPGVSSLHWWNTPSAAVVGVPLSAAGIGVQVATYGPSGAEVQNSPAAVSISLSMVPPGSFNWQGPTTQTTVNGATTFTGLLINTPGSYQIIATSPGLPTIASPTFVVSAAGASGQ